MVIVAGEVDRAAKDVENTPVDMGASALTELLVQMFWVGISEIFHTVNPKIVKIDRDTFTNARYTL